MLPKSNTYLLKIKTECEKILFFDILSRFLTIFHLIFLYLLFKLKTKFMHTGLLHAHSGLRWIVLILLVVAVLNAILKKGKGQYTEGDRKLNLFTMVFFHVQFLIGIALYFISPIVNFSEGFMKDTIRRFFGMEHTLIMVIAFILITIGHSKSKKAESPVQKNKYIMLFYGIALVLILAGIPWPFRELGRGWF